MVTIKNMHIREPASKLSKDVGTPLKFHLGNREATLFTKSTEYGKYLDNGVNEYLEKDRENRDMRERFVQHFNIAEDDGPEDIFVSATPSIHEEQANEAEARAEVNRTQSARQRRREEARAAVRPVIEEMLQETMNGIDSIIRKNESKGRATGFDNNPNNPKRVPEPRAEPRPPKPKRHLSAKAQLKEARRQKKKKTRSEHRMKKKGKKKWIRE
jgi:hypothetical protein